MFEHTPVTSGDESPRLVPYAQASYHNRNRTYQPGLGRFLQMDPYKSGLVVMERLPSLGSGFNIEQPNVSLEQRLTDGLSLYQYNRSNPMMYGDPTGLFASYLIPGPLDMATGALASMITEYSLRMEWDVDWAEDMRASDNMHSRLDSDWVLVSLGRGIYDSFSIGFGDFQFNPLDHVHSYNTAALLIPAVIIRENGVEIRHNYRSGDHSPVHVHVRSEGQKETRVGPKGHPIQPGRDRELTINERRVFYKPDNHLKIKNRIRRIQRWLRTQPGGPPRRR